MREIKLRAWQKDKKIMCEVSSIYFKGIQATLIEKPNVFNTREFKDIVLMQYTGLKDKNGKEIYEGDIVIRTDFKMPDEESPYKLKGVVKIEDGAIWISNSERTTILFSRAINTLEVVGNIYENKEQMEV